MMLLVDEDHDCGKTRLLTTFQNVVQLMSGHFGVVLASFGDCYRSAPRLKIKIRTFKNFIFSSRGVKSIKMG